MPNYIRAWGKKKEKSVELVLYLNIDILFVGFLH